VFGASDEVLKLDRWSEDLKKGLELEIKDLDRQLRQMRSEAKLADSLADKLEAQKQIKALEQIRNRNRKELYEQQDRIDGQRDELIAGVEQQLKQRHSCERVFQVRWRLT